MLVYYTLAIVVTTIVCQKRQLSSGWDKSGDSFSAKLESGENKLRSCCYRQPTQMYTLQFLIGIVSRDYLTKPLKTSPTANMVYFTQFRMLPEPWIRSRRAQKQWALEAEVSRFLVYASQGPYLVARLVRKKVAGTDPDTNLLGHSSFWLVVHYSLRSNRS